VLLAIKSLISSTRFFGKKYAVNVYLHKQDRARQGIGLVGPGKVSPFDAFAVECHCLFTEDTASVHQAYSSALIPSMYSRSIHANVLGWNTILRLYGPLKPWFNKTWGPVEGIESSSMILGLQCLLAATAPPKRSAPGF
jgi:hypothetical protein